MKLIDSSYEILHQGKSIMDMFKFITQVGHICYKSNADITDESSIAFVQKLIDSGHMALLEHGTVVLSFPYYSEWYARHKKIHKLITNLMTNPYAKWYVSKKEGTPMLLKIVTNFRIIIEEGCIDLMKGYWDSSNDKERQRYSVKFICDRGVSHKRFVA